MPAPKQAGQTVRNFFSTVPVPLQKGHGCSWVMLMLLPPPLPPKLPPPPMPLISLPVPPHVGHLTEVVTSKTFAPLQLVQLTNCSTMAASSTPLA